jgi:hypothetical protein
MTRKGLLDQANGLALTDAGGASTVSQVCSYSI